MAETACPQHYLDGRPPGLTEPPDGVRELCQTAFANLWDPRTRDPVYAAEHLKAANLIAGASLERGNGFHADPRLLPGLRAEMSDYAGGEYDRGHMAPAHDMPTAAAEHESFALSNMVPQEPSNNRGPWAHLEELTRKLVVGVYQGEAWVVSGPVFDGDPKLLAHHVAIPTRLFKAIYLPANEAQHAPLVVGAWIVRNAADPETKFVSLDELKADVGVDAFPSLSAEMHATARPPATATH